MPVPRIYGDTIYIAIEDNIHGQFHPCILTIPIIGNQHLYVDGNSLLRKQVSEGVIPIENYSGAPYLAIDSLGVQYISCQTTYGREDNNQSTATMLLLIREDNKITEMTYPFDIPQDKYGKWGAIELKNDHEMWVTISSNVEGQCAPYIMKGEIIEIEN